MKMMWKMESYCLPFLLLLLLTLLVVIVVYSIVFLVIIIVKLSPYQSLSLTKPQIVLFPTYWNRVKEVEDLKYPTL